MKMVRLGVVGLGNMGSVHARNLLDGKISRAVLTAVCDENPATKSRVPGVPYFPTIEVMIASGLIDAVLIATPHFSHTTIGISALKAGLHVLVEKPVSVHKTDCEKLFEAYSPGRQVFAAMFNQRTDPLYQKLRELVQKNELGALRRIQWTATSWFRTQAYYDSGGWRATWAGEGGGVLLNQCPHNLDLWQWLFGMPDEVRAFASTGRFHDIEVEDDVTAYFRYCDGTTGTFITSTGEAPGTNRLEVVAEQGRVVVENRQLSFLRNETQMSDFSKASKAPFDAPATWNISIPISGNGAQHNGVITNFVESILDGTPLISPATEGIHSVELANAMLLSSFTDSTVRLPLDGARYSNFLQTKIENSRQKAPVSFVPDVSDLSGSFSFK